MTRRQLLKLIAAAGATAMTSRRAVAGPASSPSRPRFPSDDPKWSRTWDAAIAVLTDNVQVMPRFDQPVLIEGSTYAGVWQECGPQEGLVYATLAEYLPAANTEGEALPSPIDVAKANHRAFFALQKDDGQLSANVKRSGVGFAQIQMVVPIAATAWETAQLSHDESFLAAAYDACALWDRWLRDHRNTRKTGLVEGFCTYDTGHDNSPRWREIPNRCPEDDAKNCPPIESLPRLCPDMSATVFGGRIALASMAEALGKRHEVEQWQESAEQIRRLIIDKLYCAEDAAFYDLDATGRFVKVRSDVISRVLGEHVLNLGDARDRQIFNAVWDHQLHNPKAFWPAYPLPSIALDDPAFVRPIPRNSWGGASQALTALRAPRWMEHYGKGDELKLLMRQWVEAIALDGQFRQQLDPLTGEFTQPDPGGYSPAALVYLDFVRRLSSAV